MKWEAVLKGVGKLYRAVYDEMGKSGDKTVPARHWLMPHTKWALNLEKT